MDYINSIERTSTVAEVANALRRKIIVGEYQCGDLLSETVLSEKFLVSRGSIRPALYELEKEGLIRTLSNGRKEVVGVTEKDIVDLYQIRCLLECHATQLILNQGFANYAPLASAVHDLEELTEETDINLWHQKQSSTHERFHQAIVEMSGNRALIQCWTAQQPLQFALSTINTETIHTDDYIDEYIVKHKKILQMIVNNDKAIIAYMEQHICVDALNTTLQGIRKLRKES